MNEPYSPNFRAWGPGPGQGAVPVQSLAQESFPGIEGPFPGPPGSGFANPTILPAQAVQGAAKGGLPFNLSNLNELKGLVDRLGGIEGIMANIGKVQKFMSTMQQIAPMIKLFLPGKKGAADADSDEEAPVRRRRRRRRRRGPYAGTGAARRRSRRENSAKFAAARPMRRRRRR